MSIDFQQLILDHVTIPARARPVVGWRVRHDPCFPMIRRFDVTTNGGRTWATTREWTGLLAPSEVETALAELVATCGTARLTAFVESEPESDEWVPVKPGAHVLAEGDLRIVEDWSE